MKHVRIHFQVGRGSSWLGRLAGLLLALGVAACVFLLIFGIWLAFGVVLVVGLAAVVLRAVFPSGRREPRMEPPPVVTSENKSRD